MKMSGVDNPEEFSRLTFLALLPQVMKASMPSAN
jgi:hypothetical protein